MQFIETKEVSSRSPREMKFAHCIFSLEDFLKKSSKWGAYPLVFQHDFHGLYLSQGKEKLPFESCVIQTESSTQQILNYGGTTKRINFNFPRRWTSESIEPNDNDLELKAIGYTFSKIFQPEM